MSRRKNLHSTLQCFSGSCLLLYHPVPASVFLRLPSYFYFNFPLSDPGYVAGTKSAISTKHANPPSMASTDVRTCVTDPWSEEDMQTCTSTACLGHSVAMLNLLPLVAQSIWSMSFPRSLIGIYGTTCAAWDQFPATPGFQYCPPGTEPHSQ